MSLYWCIYAIFNDPSFLDTCSLSLSSHGNASSIVIFFHLLKILPRPLQDSFRVSYKGATQVLITLDEIPASEPGFKKFSPSSELTFIIIIIIIIIIIYSLRVFHISVIWWSFNWRLNDSKTPQVSRTLLSILAVLNNAAVWMVSTRPPSSKSSFNNPLVSVPKAPITIGIIVTFMFYSLFFLFSSKVEVLILRFTFFQFYSVVSRDNKIYNFASSPCFVVDYYKVWSSGRD